jgi:hypothetical protein
MWHIEGRREKHTGFWWWWWWCPKEDNTRISMYKWESNVKMDLKEI